MEGDSPNMLAYFAATSLGPAFLGNALIWSLSGPPMLAFFDWVGIGLLLGATLQSVLVGISVSILPFLAFHWLVSRRTTSDLWPSVLGGALISLVGAGLLLALLTGLQDIQLTNWLLSGATITMMTGAFSGLLYFLIDCRMSRRIDGSSTP